MVMQIIKSFCCYCWLQADFFDKRLCCRFSFGHGELVTGDGVGEVSGDLSLHLRLPFVSEPRTRMSVTHPLSPRPLLSERSLGIDYYRQLGKMEIYVTIYKCFQPRPQGAFPWPWGRA